MKSSEITNTDDLIDSRDVIARIEELEGEQSELLEAEEGSEEQSEEAHEAFLAWEDEFGDELDSLRKLAEQADGSPDWAYGESLIRDTFFETYAQELAEDIGAVKDDASWPNNCIDWKRAARELQQDYMSVDFAGVTYWIRA